MLRMKCLRSASFLSVLLVLAFAFQAQPPKMDRIIRHNNRGVALMEQQKFQEAGEQFRKTFEIDPEFAPGYTNLAIAHFNLQQYDEALQLLKKNLERDPDQIQAHFMLGLIYRNQDLVDQAIEEFQKVSSRDPEDWSTNYYLGLLYTRKKEYPRAVELFEKVIAKEPNNASAFYNLAIALIRNEKREEGQKAMEEFRRLQEKFGTTTVGLQYLEQGKYSAAMEDIPAKYLDDTTPAEPDSAITFKDVASEKGLLFQHRGASHSDLEIESASDLEQKAVPHVGSGLAFGDYDNDGWLDLFIANADSEGKARNALFHNNGEGSFSEVTLKAGIHYAGRTMAALWGDFNNDTFADLYLINYGPNVLYQNNQKGAFTDVTETAKVGDPSWGVSGAFVDFDHDGDLDIFVANFVDPSSVPAQGADLGAVQGWESLRGADNVLYRNNGNGAFADVSKESRLNGGARKTLGVMCTDFNNTRDIDFYLVNLDAPNQLFSNLRDGSFVDVAETAQAGGEKDFSGIGIGDFNQDTLMDLVLAGKENKLFIGSPNSQYRSEGLPGDLGSAHHAQSADFDNDGDLDILLVGASLFGKKALKNFALLENRNGKFQDVSERAGLGRFQALPVRGASIADFDNDGDLDFAFNINGAAPLLLRNEGGNKNNWIALQTSGTNSNKPGIGTKVEMKAGRLWQKVEVYGGHGFLSQSPALAHFGLGKRDKVDVVRLLWPGGVLQSEIDLPVNQRSKLQELDRKGTSCPILYSWNGKSYEFVTDFLGGSAYGYLLAPGVYNSPDTDEYVKLDRNKLSLKDGKLAITLNNQLEEVIMFDQLELLAVDHPAEYEIIPDEKLLPGPPYQDLRLFTVSRTRPPVSAKDGEGKNVLPAVSRIDRRYAEIFQKLPFKGYAEPHELILDLGTLPWERAILLMHAWIDYADSTSNLAASQAGLKLIPPYLQVQDRDGKWITAIERMGFPAGLPKTMTVDLSGKFLSASRKIRIVTNLRIYWDQILVESAPAKNDYRLTRLKPSYVNLHFRGFPEFSSPDGQEPKLYWYDRISEVGGWKAHVGGYTRYGDVLPLLLSRDDMFVITRAGDEIESCFDVGKLPNLPGGWVRDYLIYVDGFGKDMDPNSARPDSIGPLPFHNMSRYPYPNSERYPDDEAHQRYLKEWNTRTVDRWFAELR